MAIDSRQHASILENIPIAIRAGGWGVEGFAANMALRHQILPEG